MINITKKYGASNGIITFLVRDLEVFALYIKKYLKKINFQVYSIQYDSQHKISTFIFYFIRIQNLTSMLPMYIQYIITIQSRAPYKQCPN